MVAWLRSIPLSPYRNRALQHFCWIILQMLVTWTFSRVSILPISNRLKYVMFVNDFAFWRWIKPFWWFISNQISKGQFALHLEYHIVNKSTQVCIFSLLWRVTLLFGVPQMFSESMYQTYYRCWNNATTSGWVRRVAYAFTKLREFDCLTTLIYSFRVSMKIQ